MHGYNYNYYPQYPQGYEAYPQGASVAGMYELGASQDELMALQALSGDAAQWHGVNGYTELGAGPMLPMAYGRAPYPVVPQLRSPSPSSMPARPAPLGGLQIREREPKTERVLWIGFKSAAAIAAAANSNVSASPQDTFSPRKILIPASVAPNFEVADLKVGSVSQFSSSDPIPAEAFIPDGVSTDVRFDTAQISQQVTFNVNNISNAAAVFRAAINGFVVRL